MRAKDKNPQSAAIMAYQVKAGYRTFFIETYYSEKLKLHYVQITQSHYNRRLKKYINTISRLYPSNIQTIINVLSEIQANIDDLDNLKGKKIIEDPRYSENVSRTDESAQDTDDLDFLENGEHP